MRFNHLHIILLPALLCAACASIGNPSGGPRDEDPPIFVSGSPAPGSTNVSTPRVVLTFDELINVKDQTAVVISPVTGDRPRVSSAGRRVTVAFDSLMPDVTYTIDFGGAIEDNNEGNKLENFVYSFATGSVLDTLRISGMVLGARDLEPQQGMLVGVYEDMADSAFLTRPMLRVAKTDDYGRFSIRGLKQVPYRVFALTDNDNNSYFSSFEEDIAYYPTAVTPRFEEAVANDTVYTPLGEIDSVSSRIRTRFLPDNIVLRSYNTGQLKQFLTEYNRLDSTRLFLKFNAPSTALPRLTPLTDVGADSTWYTLERSEKGDSLVYWLTPEALRVDSLRVAVDWQRPDSVGLPEWKSDTLRFFTPRPKVARTAKKTEKPRPMSVTDSLARITFSFKMLTSPMHEVYEPVRLEFPVPLASLDTSLIHLEQLIDSTWTPLRQPVSIYRPDSIALRRLDIASYWKYGERYRLQVDTLAATDLYGKVSRPLNFEFSAKKADEYCTITFRLNGLLSGEQAFVELLNSGDKIIRTERVADNRVTFRYLQPGRYFARLILDYDGDGLYDTGRYDVIDGQYTATQPEVAYYYPKAINIKKNWDKEEDWDLFTTALDQQKPSAVKINKPKTKRRSTANEADDDDEDDDDYFDPTANPFDPNDRTKRRTTTRR